MKIIHCSDLHLDSKMNTNFTSERAKERRNELLMSFRRMVSYAADTGVEAILICGDLFDTRNISATAKNAVESEIINHPDIRFYYISGNHESDTFTQGLEDIPGNLFLFGTNWTSYDEDGGLLCISGLELCEETSGSIYSSLVLNHECLNIVMLHGQDADSLSTGKDKAEVIHIREFKNKAIDYLALGHIHSYREDRIDARGRFCYSGCLEPRGFDEIGEHGFVLLETSENYQDGIKSTFIPFASRTLYEAKVDISGLSNTFDVINLIKDKADEVGATSEDMLRVVLCGFRDAETEFDISVVINGLFDSFYAFKIYDETSLRVDYSKYALDESLKGEFVRTVQARTDLSWDEKGRIIMYGLKAIAGEEIEL